MKLPTAPILVMIAELEPAVEFKVWQAIQGGLDMVILRAKDADLESIRSTVSTMRTALGNEFPILVNAGNRLPKFAQASGFHVPESGLSDKAAKESLEKQGRKIGEEPNKVATKSKGLGISVHSEDAARAAEKFFPDYLLVGTIFETHSHPGVTAGGLDHLRAVCNSTIVPVIAIGGITPANAGDCIKSGAIGVAAFSPFKGAGRQELARAYKEKMIEALKQK